MRNKECWYYKVCNNDCEGCIRYIEMKYLMDSSGIPTAQQIPKRLTAETAADKKAFQKLQTIKENIVKWVAAGKNLYICSPSVGTGKTSWAIKLMLRFFDQIWSGNGQTVRGLFVHVPTLLLQLKNFENPVSEEYKQNLLDADLIIWDDIAASTKISEYDYAQLLMFIDSRIFNEKSNIYTSNITNKEDLENILGARLVSRIYNASEIVTFEGKDGREVYKK